MNERIASLPFVLIHSSLLTITAAFISSGDVQQSLLTFNHVYFWLLHHTGNLV